MDNFRDSYFSVTWDLTKKHLHGTFWGKQYDTGRGFAVTIVEGSQVTVPSTETVRLKWEKPDGTEGYVTAVVVDNKFLIEDIDQMFTVHGAVRSDLEIWRGGKVISSITFYVSVEKAVAVDAIESSSQFTALQDELIRVETAIAGATVDTEVILARGAEPTLGARLDADKVDIIEQLNTLFTTGKNLFNPYDKDLMIGYKLISGGTLSLTEGYVTSGYIPVSEGDDIVWSKNNSSQWSYVGHYDANKSYLYYSTGSEPLITTAKYIRVSMLADLSVDKIQIEKGTARTGYEDFYYKSTEIVLPPDEVVNARGTEPTLGARLDADKAETEQEIMSFKEDYANVRNSFVVGKNKYNPNDRDIIYDYRINTFGNVILAASALTTGYIPVTPGDYIVLSADGVVQSRAGCACYDENKTFISGSYLGTSKTPYLVPAGAVYIRVSILYVVTTLGKVQIEIGQVPTEYEPYRFVYRYLDSPDTPDVCDSKLPEYMEQEINRVENLVIDSNADFRYAFFTDSHISKSSDLTKIQQVVELNRVGMIDVVIDGGDSCVGQPTKQQAVDLMREYAKTIKDTNSDVVCVRGNHDVYAKYDSINPDQYMIKTSLWSNIFCNHQNNKAIFDENNPLGGYYYKDYAKSKIRMIFLNTSDVLDDQGHWLGKDDGIAVDEKRIQQPQLDWLCNKALNFADKGIDKANWGVITIGHGALFGSSHAIQTQQPQLIGILSAFITGGTFSLTTDAGKKFQLTSNADFTQQGAMEYICHHCGDAHWDFISYQTIMGGKTPPYIRTANMGNLRKTTSPTDYATSGDIFTMVTPIRGSGGESGDGTVSCELMDVFNVDRHTKTITAIRYGAGGNRIIPYDKDVAVSISSTQTLVSVLEGTLIWESKNLGRATVSNGVVTGVAVGQVIITATDEKGQIEAWRIIVS